MPAELACVDPKEVQNWWPHISNYIKRAIAKGDGDFTTTERHVLEGKALLWLAHEENHILAAAVTQIITDHRGKVCNIVACGGHDWARFGSLIGGIEKYARNENCIASEIPHGRRGWIRLLPDYALKHVTLRKELI